MKKTLLSFLTVGLIGLSTSAQDFAIYNGSTSTTDISGTTIEVNADDLYSGYLYVKNLTGSDKTVKITRVQILTPAAAVAEQVCWGAAGSLGLCFDVPSSATNWSSGEVTLTDANKGLLELHVDLKSTYNLFHYRYYLDGGHGTIYDSVDIKIKNVASIKEVKNTVSFNAFPNPANDVINLTVQGTAGDNSVKLVDVLGNIVLEDRINASKKLDVSDFKNGVYILTVYSNNGSLLQTKRIVIRH